MFDDESDDKLLYKVVVNDEEQYSIWPAKKNNPPGWREAGKSGLKQECLSYIASVWTDMRPRSLREYMDKLPHRPVA
jgi:MbtH protein